MLINWQKLFLLCVPMLVAATDVSAAIFRNPVFRSKISNTQSSAYYKIDGNGIHLVGDKEYDKNWNCRLTKNEKTRVQYDCQTTFESHNQHYQINIYSVGAFQGENCMLRVLEFSMYDGSMRSYDLTTDTKNCGTVIDEMQISYVPPVTQQKIRNPLFARPWKSDKPGVMPDIELHPDKIIQKNPDREVKDCTLIINEWGRIAYECTDGGGIPGQTSKVYRVFYLLEYTPKNGYNEAIISEHDDTKLFGDGVRYVRYRGTSTESPYRRQY